MDGCEKCWSEAGVLYANGQGEYESKTEAYHKVLELRELTPCTPKEQAGDWWDNEKQIDTREAKA